MGIPLTGAPNARGYEKSRIASNIGLYLGADAVMHDRAIVTVEGIRNHIRAFEWYQFEWPWVTCNPDFKVTILLNVK